MNPKFAVDKVSAVANKMSQSDLVVLPAVELLWNHGHLGPG